MIGISIVVLYSLFALISTLDLIETVNYGRVIVNPTLSGFSGKTSNLYYGLEAANEDLVVLVDSDGYADNDTLVKMYKQLQAGYDIVTAVPIHREAQNIWARFYSMFWNFNQLGLYLNSLIHYDSGNLIGICVMTRKTVLDDIGGVGSIKDYIAEDLALGKKAAKKGYGIGLGPIVYSSVGHMDFSDLVNKFKRAALSSGAMNFREVVRSAVPISYLFGIVMVLILKEFGWVIHISLLLFIRILFSSISMYELDKKVRLRIEVIAMDLIFIMVYIYSLFDKTIEWGNIKYKVDKYGKIIRSEVG